MRTPCDPAAEYLSKLGVELIARGITCELITTGCAPRLRLDIAWLGGFEDAAFEDHILAASEPDGQWRFWWPWIQPLAPVDDITRAANRLVESMSLAGEEDSDAEEPEKEDADRMLQLMGLTRIQHRTSG